MFLENYDNINDFRPVLFTYKITKHLNVSDVVQGCGLMAMTFVAGSLKSPLSGGLFTNVDCSHSVWGT